MKTILTLPFLAAAVAAQGVPSHKPITPQAPAPLQKSAPLAATKTAGALSPIAGGGHAAPMKPTAAELASRAPSPFAAPDFLMFDEPSPGAVWVHGRDYKAGCTAAGLEFIAAPPTPALPGSSVRFTLRSARVGSTALTLENAAPTRTGNRIVWQRGALTERVDVAPAQVEQSFAFDALPARGELELVLAVTTGTVGEDLGDGIRFRGASDVRYGEAVAIDAEGHRVHAETRLDGNQITIAVPAAFVAAATLPLVIDPIVQSTTVVTDTAELVSPDLAWDDSAQCWAVVYERAFSSLDSDAYLQRLGPTLVPIGGLITIDFSGTSWQRLRIADNNLNDVFLVVAEENLNHTGMRWIGGRTCSNTGSTGLQFDIEKAGIANHGTGDCFHPDVAGDPSLAGPTWFTVVWEEAFALNAADHDIAMKQVSFNGTLRHAAPTWVATSNRNETNPSISKSAGGGDWHDQVLAIVYESEFAVLDHDIHGALYTWDGNVVAVGGYGTFVIDASTAYDSHPEVSTSTLGVGLRRFLVAYSRPLSGNGDIVATCFTSAGNVLGSGIVPSPSGWRATEPAVDCDGARFALARTFLYSGSGNDTDIQVSLLNWNGTTLQMQASEQAVHAATPESMPAIASRYSGSGEANMHYAIANRDHDNAGWHIEAETYDGYGAASVSTRPTGCGGLSFGISAGVPTLGETVWFSVASQHPITGVVLGFPTAQPIPGCPGCILGVNGSAVLANPTPLHLPPDARLIGLVLSAQGFTFAGGPCLATVSASDTVDFAIQ